MPHTCDCDYCIKTRKKLIFWRSVAALCFGALLVIVISSAIIIFFLASDTWSAILAQ